MKQRSNESWGYEVWDKTGNVMYVAGAAKNPDHAVELIQEEMKKKKDKNAEGVITRDGDVIDTKRWDDLFE